MEVSPTELIFTTFGETQTVSILFYDENGNEIEHPTPTISSLVDPDGANDGTTTPVSEVVEWRSVPGGLEVTALGYGDGSIAIIDLEPTFANKPAQSVTLPVSVLQILTTLTVTPDSLNLAVGETTTLQAALTDANGL